MEQFKGKATIRADLINRDRLQYLLSDPVEGWEPLKFVKMERKDLLSIIQAPAAARYAAQDAWLVYSLTGKVIELQDADARFLFEQVYGPIVYGSMAALEAKRSAGQKGGNTRTKNQLQQQMKAAGEPVQAKTAPAAGTEDVKPISFKKGQFTELADAFKETIDDFYLDYFDDEVSKLWGSLVLSEWRYEGFPIRKKEDLLSLFRVITDLSLLRSECESWKIQHPGSMGKELSEMGLDPLPANICIDIYKQRYAEALAYYKDFRKAYDFVSGYEAIEGNNSRFKAANDSGKIWYLAEEYWEEDSNGRPQKTRYNETIYRYRAIETETLEAAIESHNYNAEFVEV